MQESSPSSQYPKLIKQKNNIDNHNAGEWLGFSQLCRSASPLPQNQTGWSLQGATFCKIHFPIKVNIQKIQMILSIRIYFQMIQKFLTKHLRDGVIKENPLRDSSYSNVQPDQPVDDGHYFSWAQQPSPLPSLCTGPTRCLGRWLADELEKPLESLKDSSESRFGHFWAFWTVIAETSAPASTLEEALKSAELEENVIANYKSQLCKLQLANCKL